MIAELFLIMDLLKGTVQTNGTPSLPSTGSEVKRGFFDLPTKVLDKSPIYETSITGVGAGSAELRRQRRELFK
jgi:hypothetical protein